jgi:hypothetical protein
MELEGRATVKCREARCIARSVIDLIVRKLGIESSVDVKKLAELAETGDIYFTSFTVDGIKIAVRDIYYDWDADDCGYLDDCAGAITVRFEVDGDADRMKQIVMKLLKDIGADKYVKICE